ncbi:ABC transporter permease [Sporosarcina psychrophila]|uniref:ABC transporter permease n=1 Tax=Sporosarcina psychrophila TaxID=1476 RepID=UPI00078D8EF8|nr:ABC transporter permease [Sporosarcina psychrophila]AMQ04972.1 ABC transporter permease [Sporosarcina psychrophila]
MLGYILKRGVQTLVVLFLTITLVFFIIRLSGDPTYLYMPDDATEEMAEQFREQLGFNRPLIVQYGSFLADVAKGDFGESLIYRQDALSIVLAKIPATFQLAFSALFVAIAVAIPLGVISAYKQNTIYDRIGTGITVLGQAIPGFWLGLLLILVFSVMFKMLPSGGGGSAIHLILPAVTLAAHSAARFARFTRSTMLDVLRKDYIRTVKSTGASTFSILYKYGLKNTLIPIITIAALDLGVLLGGAVIIESVFSWPGLGQLLIKALMGRDFPVVIAGVFFIALSISIINFFADILYGLVNPQVRVK